MTHLLSRLGEVGSYKQALKCKNYAHERGEKDNTKDNRSSCGFMKLFDTAMFFQTTSSVFCFVAFSRKILQK